MSSRARQRQRRTSDAASDKTGSLVDTEEVAGRSTEGTGGSSSDEGAASAGSASDVSGSDASGSDAEGSVSGEGSDGGSDFSDGGNGMDEAAPDVSATEGGGKVIRDAQGKVLTKEALEEFRKKEKKKGVVYLGRVPPFMKPQKVRHLLSQYGEIGRLYLVPEDAAIQRRRRKRGGSRKINFTEGWVEFLNKKHAKRVAAFLNNQKVGGKRRSFHYEDLWNIKYLPKFKWHHLTQKIAYERRIRAQRLRAELAQAKREAAYYVHKAEAAKSLESQEKRKLAEAAAKGNKGAVAAVHAERNKIRRKFRQTGVVTKNDALATPLLRKMMGKKRARKDTDGKASSTKKARAK